MHVDDLMISCSSSGGVNFGKGNEEVEAEILLHHVIVRITKSEPLESLIKKLNDIRGWGWAFLFFSVLSFFYRQEKCRKNRREGGKKGEGGGFAFSFLARPFPSPFEKSHFRGQRKARLIILIPIGLPFLYI